MCAAPQRTILCSSLMLPPRGIFPKFCSIPFLMCPSAPTITATDSVFTPHFLEVSISRSLCFENVLLTFVEVFRLDTSISLQHQLAWSMITISGLFVNSSLSVCICITQRIDFFIFGNRFGLVFLPPLWDAFQWIYAAALLYLSR